MKANRSAWQAQEAIKQGRRDAPGLDPVGSGGRQQAGRRDAPTGLNKLHSLLAMLPYVGAALLRGNTNADYSTQRYTTTSGTH